MSEYNDYEKRYFWGLVEKKKITVEATIISVKRLEPSEGLKEEFISCPTSRINDHEEDEK